MNRNARNKILVTPVASSVPRQNAQEGKDNLYLGRSIYVSITEVTSISAIGVIIGTYLFERKKKPIIKQHSTQIKKLSDTVVRREDDVM